MIPIYFEGSHEVKKPVNMTDEECFSVWAKQVRDYFDDKFIPEHFLKVLNKESVTTLVAWKPSYEDLKALNSGQPFYVQTFLPFLPPMAIFTVDEDGNCNDPD